MPSLLGNLIKEKFQEVANFILNGIKEIFIPDEDYITNRWNNIRGRFAFADNVSKTIEIIVRFFKETAFDVPPKIYIDLSAAESSKYDYGETTYCLDMTWYARYKRVVDPFLSAWLWLIFLFRIYTRLPSIIGGAGSDFQTVNNFYQYGKPKYLLPPGQKKGRNK